MIESCSKKQMLTAISCLGGLTIVILILESHWTSDNGSVFSSKHNNGTCWLTEDYEVLDDCQPCTAFEVTSKSVPACVATGYKEILFCKSSGKVFRSCDKVTWIEERKFWTFEGTILFAAALSCFVVYSRQRILDHQMLQRIQRQLARGV